ncbi:MAG: TusE/DsrC/DsvC family sulfur relay protein [bacterium]|nr:TusE/DsrC/DsvC family sulfur relay protein [bacterium]
MGERLGKPSESEFDEQGFLRMMTGADPVTVEQLAKQIKIGPLTEDHWKVIDFVKVYYEEHGVGPPVVKIGKVTGLHLTEICQLFPCGVVRGAYRLAGLPRPAGCI